MESVKFSDEIAELYESLCSDDAIEAIEAAYSLGDNPAKNEALNALILGLKKVEAEVKLVIIDILSQTDFFGEEIVLPLCELLSDEDAEVRAHAASVVGTTKDIRAVDCLMTALDLESDAETRYAMMSAIAAIGDKKASIFLERWINSDKWLDRFNAVDALGNLADDRSIPILVKALSDPHPKVRENAILSVGYFNSSEITNKLIQLLEDDDLAVVAAAVYVLGEYKAPEAMPSLIDLLKCEEEDLIILSIEALAKIRNEEAASPICVLLNHSSPHVVGAVKEALDLFPPTSFLESLFDNIYSDPKFVYLNRLISDKKKNEGILEAMQEIHMPDWVIRLITMLMLKRKRGGS